MNKFTVLGLLFVALLFVGCATTADHEAGRPAETEPAVEEPEPEIADIEPQDVGPAEILTPAEEPADNETEEEQQEELEEAEEAEEIVEAQEEPYIPTQETYERTFTEVEETIGRLNEIIRERDFDEWKSYLTDEYLREMSSPDTLRELSDHRILKRNNIVLESLEDYFTFVVVPSRANARLDDLVFRNDEEVEAIMVVQGQRVILYQLAKVDGTWKIAIF